MLFDKICCYALLERILLRMNNTSNSENSVTRIRDGDFNPKRILFIIAFKSPIKVVGDII